MQEHAPLLPPLPWEIQTLLRAHNFLPSRLNPFTGVAVTVTRYPCFSSFDSMLWKCFSSLKCTPTLSKGISWILILQIIIAASHNARVEINLAGNHGVWVGLMGLRWLGGQHSVVYTSYSYWESKCSASGRRIFFKLFWTTTYPGAPVQLIKCSLLLFFVTNNARRGLYHAPLSSVNFRKSILRNNYVLNGR